MNKAEIGVVQLQDKEHQGWVEYQEKLRRGKDGSSVSKEAQRWTETL